MTVYIATYVNNLLVSPFSILVNTMSSEKYFKKLESRVNEIYPDSKIEYMTASEMIEKLSKHTTCPIIMSRSTNPFFTIFKKQFPNSELYFDINNQLKKAWCF